MASTSYDPERTYEFEVKDVEYLHDGDQSFLASVYQPQGPGPFPALLDIHGGAWTNGDRSNNPQIMKGLAAGGIVVDDSTGSVLFATGNAIPCAGSVNSDSVIHTNAALGSPTSFQPQDWQANWCGPDLDLGSTTPTIINPNLIFMSGKYGQGFLLDPNNLTGVDSQVFPARSPYMGVDVCAGNHSDATFGSFAYAAPRLYLECDYRGLVSLTVNTTAPSFSVCDSTCAAAGTWRAAPSLEFGPPIVAGGAVWVVDINGSGLYGFDASTGAQIYHSASFSVTHFSTPSEAGGQIFVSSLDVVRSFKVVPGCTSVALSANPPSPVAVGTVVTLTATASGCPDATPLYQFWMAAPGGSWQIVQPYSTTATFTWNTAAPEGTYSLSVWARDSKSGGAFGDSTGHWDAYSSAQYTLNPFQCSSVNLTTSPPATAASGTAVTLTGAASGCPNPVYQFWIAAPGGNWQIVQAYSISATYTWLTTGHAPGTYSISVWTRDASASGAFGNGTGRWDAYQSGTYSLTSTPCTAVGLAASPPNSSPAGTTVALTGTATGCASPLYQFWIASPGGSWQIVQAYSSTATYTWNSTPGAAGVYGISVWARDSSSIGVSGNPTGRWDAYASGSYTLTTTPCSSVTSTAAPPSSAAVGTTVTLTGSASGCPNPLYQFWIADPGGNWRMVQAYSTSATYTWNTAGAARGTYSISVWVRDASSNGVNGNSTGRWDAYSSGHYSLS